MLLPSDAFLRNALLSSLWINPYSLFPIPYFDLRDDFFDLRSELFCCDHEELDLIWCEGAIYNIGFERGLNEWRRFIKPGGYLVVSEASWFTWERPTEIQKFWQVAYPEIRYDTE